MSTRSTNPVFTKLYRGLNAAQKKAVDTLEGPVMVVAGPGTGKTQILTLRIAHILKETDTPPDAILALTFTESGVTAMRKRLVRVIGSAAYRVHIFTFHGFCNEVIRRYPEDFDRIIGAEPATDIEKIDILRSIISAHTFEYLKPFGDVFYYVNDIRQAISEMKRENITPEKLRQALVTARKTFEATDGLYHEKGAHQGKMKGIHESTAKRLARTEELLVVYSAYQAALGEKRLYDFDDMLVEAVSALETKPDLLLKVQEEYHYLLADEHQDANTAQNRLLELLASFHEQPNIFVVGDEKQAIFRFQGASLDNFFYFKKAYPNAVLIPLTEGYRSGQRILDVSHSMIQKDGVEGRVALVSRAGVARDAVTVHVCGSTAAERAYVVDAVRQCIGEGVEPAEIAVLYRTNGEAAEWARAFEDRGVFVSVESDQNALADPDIRKLVVYLTGITRMGDDTSMGELLHVPFSGVAPLDAYKIIHHARKVRACIADVLRSRALLEEARVADIDAALGLYTKIEQYARASGSVPSIVGDIIRDSGYLAHILASPRAVELVEKLAGFVRDVEKLSIGQADYNLSKLLAHLLLLDEYRIPITKEVRAAPRAGAVRLMTAHKSKGLEFDYVFIVNAVDGHWGGRRTRAHFSLPTGSVDGDDNDERRLLYVALTRARVSVSLSYAHEKDGKGHLPTRFIEEMDQSLVQTIVHNEQHDHALDLARVPAQAHVSLPDKAFLNELFLEQGLSVTALNNYLACPWRYFYSNLIRIPMAPTNALLYGNAIDRALKRFFEKFRDEGVAALDTLISLYREAVLRQPLPEKETAEMERRGIEHLTAWHTQWQSTFVRETLSGYSVRTDLELLGTLPRVLLRGELDKVEFLADGTVRVVDYKTGKPKSRNAIMGKTKSDDGEYFRQLTFYKLLLSREGKYRMHEGMLDFIQPDERGRLHREVFGSDELDTDALAHTIETAAQEIWSLAFWDRTCGEPDCTYCSLRAMMQ